MSETSQLLSKLGVYGYDEVESIILAALVTEDPLLLIGKAGTGKTYLLNSLSEALDLEHRHYNASMIAFDDLVGFPYPEPKQDSIRYLETPATVWQAESVLIDEISRCKPEHQNRLFSLVHERRIQGLSLANLRYRWAAMNPCNHDADLDEIYDGSQPLDQALADRFGFLLEVPDWNALSDHDRSRIADPKGEGQRSRDEVGLAAFLEKARETYQSLLDSAPLAPRQYAVAASTLLGDAHIRISPRRARQLTRNLYAVMALRNGHIDESDFQQVLTWSIPHRAWGANLSSEHILAAHRVAWDSTFLSGKAAWLNQLLTEQSLPKLVRRLLREVPDADTGSIAVSQCLSQSGADRKAAFAFALYPAALEGRLPIGREGINELARTAAKIVDVSGKLHWNVPRSKQPRGNPEWVRLSAALKNRRGKRRERAEQLFNYLLVKKINIEDPTAYEEEFNQCIAEVRSHLRAS